MLSHQSAILTLSFLSPSIEDKMKFTDSFPAPVNTEVNIYFTFYPTAISESEALLPAAPLDRAVRVNKFNE